LPGEFGLQCFPAGSASIAHVIPAQDGSTLRRYEGSRMACCAIDLTFLWLLRIAFVGNTAAPNNDSFAMAGDATSVTSISTEATAVGATSD
jgi:hypothetical protein